MAVLHTVAEYKNSVAGMLSGIDLNNVEDLDPTLERAASTLVQKADIPEASGIQNITLYAGVIDYACDTRIFGTAITDIRPQGVSRNPSDFVYKKPQELFDRTKNWLPNGTMTTFEYRNGVPIIRIVSTVTQQQVIIDSMTSDDDWTAGGTASNLITDTSIFYQTPGSLRFNLTTGAGTLTKTLTSPIDISAYENFGVGFLAIQIPTGATASNLTSMSVKLGSSASDYSVRNATEGFLGTWVSGEWLLVAYDFSSSSDVGTPDWSAIDYIQVTLNVTGSFTNFHLGGFWVAQPSQNQILYQSSAIFLPSGSTTALETITDDTDTIILNVPAYNLYLREGALAVLGNTGAGASDATYIKIQKELDGNGSTDIGLYARFRGDNPSEELRQVGSYYDNDIGYSTNC